VVLWNAENQWASFAFQGSKRVGEMGGFKPRFFFVLLATQLLMVTPYLFSVSLAALVRNVRLWVGGGLDDRARLLLISAAVPMLLFTAVSFRSHVKLNWLAPAFWSLIILGMNHLLAKPGAGRQLRWGLASSATVLVAALAITVTPNLPIAGDMNSWSGWKEVAQRVDQAVRGAGADGKEVFVFSPNYKISSLLRFHMPGQPRVYAQDIYGARALQYDFLPLDNDLKGATGILVRSDQSQSHLDLKRLAPHFDAVELVDVIETGALGRVTRRVEIYRCTNYRGHPRNDPSRRAEGPDSDAAPDGDNP
jgi:hypothetical protein